MKASETNGFGLRMMEDAGSGHTQITKMFHLKM